MSYQYLGVKNRLWTKVSGGSLHLSKKAFDLLNVLAQLEYPPLYHDLAVVQSKIGDLKGDNLVTYGRR